MATTVSVIIPTNNRLFQLSCCLKSLFSQSRLPDEIIVVDNTGNARPLITRLAKASPAPLVYVREKKQGASYARNAGIRAARHTLLAFIDDDCRASTGWLRAGLSFYEKYGPTVIIKGTNENGLPDNVIACAEYAGDELFFRTGYLKDGTRLRATWLDTKNAFIPKRLIVKHRLYFRKYRIFEDLDFSLRAAKAGIPIQVAPPATVRHEGRTNLISHLKRQVDKGLDTKSIKQRAYRRRSAAVMSRLEQTYYKKYRPWKSGREIIRELHGQILRGRSGLFRTRFAALRWLDDRLVPAVYRMIR